MVTKEALIAFDAFLVSKAELFEATVTGGTALILLDVVSRLTEDLDLIDPDLEIGKRLLAIEFAEQHPEFELDVAWINDAASIFKKDLPKGWMDRRVVAFDGQALRLMTLGRDDFLIAKMKSYLSRGAVDTGDCIALKPNRKEFETAERYIYSLLPQDEISAAKREFDLLAAEMKLSR